MISLNAIESVLRQYAARYRFLDVFAEDVKGLDSVPLEKHGDCYISRGTTRLRIKVLPSGVIRFSLVPSGTPGTVDNGVPMLVGAALGAALGAASRKEGAVLIGMGIGLLVGALASEGPPRMNRVMALRNEEGTENWHVFDGPLLGLAKKSLAPPDSDKGGSK